jgi:V/A-type H+-transporting ATPase subunit C
MFARHFQDSLESFINAMHFTPFADLCAEGLRSYQANGRLTTFERRADDYVNTYIKKVKLSPLGVEIVVAYIVARRTELKNVRIAMVGKINKIANEAIKERLRECYA